MDTNKIEKMLVALLRSNKQLHWIGGYSWGRTSNDDPFIVLYPLSEKLKHKVCRVYPSSFRLLPAFVNTDVPEGLSDNQMDRPQAIKQRMYFETPKFQIVTYLGEETKLGLREIRFSDVLVVPANNEDRRPAPEQAEEPEDEIIVPEEPPTEPEQTGSAQGWPGRWVSLVLYHKFADHVKHFENTVKYSKIITPEADLQPIEVAGWFKNYRDFKDNKGLSTQAAGQAADQALKTYLAEKDKVPA